MSKCGTTDLFGRLKKHPELADGSKASQQLYELGGDLSVGGISRLKIRRKNALIFRDRTSGTSVLTHPGEPVPPPPTEISPDTWIFLKKASLVNGVPGSADTLFDPLSWSSRTRTSNASSNPCHLPRCLSDQNQSDHGHGGGFLQHIHRCLHLCQVTRPIHGEGGREYMSDLILLSHL